MTKRERNPERSRQRILDAAFEEFAAKGYAGARVGEIAARAGLNKQLISHYFGGKAALYRAVMSDRRSRPGGDLVEAPADLPEALGDFFDRGHGDPDWFRVLLWEVLEGEERPDVDDETRRARYRDRIAWVARQQAEGRLPAGLAPDLLYLSLMGAVFYPLTLPHITELVTGEDAFGADFAERYRRHLIELVRVLGSDERT